MSLKKSAKHTKKSGDSSASLLDHGNGLGGNISINKEGNTLSKAEKNDNKIRYKNKGEGKSSKDGHPSPGLVNANVKFDISGFSKVIEAEKS